MLIIKKTFRWIIYAILTILALMLIVAAVIRFAIFPNIDHYKDDISTLITERVGLKTTIGNIETGWDGLSPRMLIREIDIYDTENNSALHLENVMGKFSWLSILLMHPHLSYISVSNPKLIIHRKENGSIYVAGIPLAGEGKPDFANWILSQANISVKNASIVWQDDLRQAPALSFNQVYLTLKNPAWRKIFGQHLFNLSARPSIGTKYPIKLSGNFFGRDVSKITTWHGDINQETKDIDLTVWKPWMDYPIDLQSGAGNANVSLSFSKNKIDKLVADVVFHDMEARLNQNTQPFNLALLSGMVTLEKDKKTTTITARNIKLKAENELNIEGSSGLVSHTLKNNKPWINASFKLDTFDLGFLEKLQGIVTLPDNISQPLKALAPQGQLSNINVSWQGEPQNPTRYHVETEFKSLSIEAYNKIPGFKNLSGQIDANEGNGALQLASTDTLLDFKGILRWPIPAQKLNGKVTWNKKKGKLKIIANDIFIANEHISGTINSSYYMNGIKGGYLDLSGEFNNGNAKYAPFYYPTILGEDTVKWLDSSILSGKVNDVQLTVKGNLEDFPYVNAQNKLDSKLGIFKVSARISDATLEYGKSWPKIEGLGLDLLFEGKRMELNANKGQIFGTKIIKSKTTIPQLDADSPILNIVSKAEGPVAEGIKFINLSPVKEVTLGFTDDLKTAGNGQLDLSITIPLHDVDASKYKGKYKVNDGTMYANDHTGVPEIDHIYGTLAFNESGLNAQNINAETLGSPLQFNLNTKSDKTIEIDAKGTMTDADIKKTVSNAFTESLNGRADWSANITIKKPLINLNVRSNLLGLAINLPAPLGKPLDQEANFMITKKQTLADQDLFEIAYNEVVSANILRSEKNGVMTIDRCDIAINTPSKLPTEPGLVLRGKFDYINADEWLALMSKPSTSNNQSTLSINKADISIQKLDIFNRSLNALKIVAKPKNDHLTMTLSSQELDGDVEWQGAKSTEDTGKIFARLKKLHIPASNQETIEPNQSEIKRLDRKYPALDIYADDFKLGTKALGTLELIAYENNQDWVIKKLTISNPDSTLFADGNWHNWSTSPNTNLKFTLKTNDIGNTLKRFGHPDTVKGGVALISGQLKWPGSPHEFKKNGLNGEFILGASKGQILKVQPGVGRLLGLLTLQSLPRRLTLDFRDLFSEGFAFDEISANAKINDGIMRSDDFFMTGPAAETKIKGETNLNTETQHLKVKIVPHISDSLSLAALAGGPIAGVAAFVAQKILKDPLNKIVQSEYTIIGTWDNPVEADAKTEDKKTQERNSPLNAQQN